mmetsp:Transcript_22336/g.40559  ORF Transcript_22336/g.40559 Transcript_22336/m.40559 type:complete len:360 (-) Transcript_22336:209-1288(-)
MALIVETLMVETRKPVKLMSIIASSSSVASKLLFMCAVIISSYFVLIESRYLQKGLTILKPSEGTIATVTTHIRRHDSYSKFSMMKIRGFLYNEATAQHQLGALSSNELVLDTLSIGTKKNLALLQAQSITWASHKSIRHYFAATELDDVDPTCYKTLNKSTVDKIVATCKNASPTFAKGGMHYQYQKFTKGTKKSPGWICAQQRFAIALEKLGVFYRRELNLENFQLPDFMLLQDDDSYYNMVRIHDFLSERDPSVPLAEAVCLISSELQNFSFPWGGYGFILSQAAVHNLIRPVYCNATTNDKFEQHVCLQLDEDLLGERQYFEDGMSVSDLMGAQVRHNLFSQYTGDGNWMYCKYT